MNELPQKYLMTQANEIDLDLYENIVIFMFDKNEKLK